MKMRRSFRPLLVFAALSVLLLTNNNAHASSTLIEVKQINPKGAAQAIICEDRINAVCQITIPVTATDTHQQERVLVGMLNSSAGMTFTFASHNGVIILDNGSSLVVKTNRERTARQVVSLFREPYGDEGIMKEPLVRFPTRSFAELEIALSPSE